MTISPDSPWHQVPAALRVLRLVVSPAVVLLVSGMVYLAHLDGYLWGTGEDGLVEWATVVGYLLALGVAATLVPRLWRNHRLTAAAYVVLCVGFFFIAGEEVSWGQRLLGFEGPPALVEANLQDEANLHNLLDRYALHGLYILIGLWGVGVGRWVVRHVRWLRPGYAYAPSRELAWWFLPVLAYYVYIDYAVPGLTLLGLEVGEGPPRYQEVVELLLAVGFLLFVVEARLRFVGSTRPTREPSPAGLPS